MGLLDQLGQAAAGMMGGGDKNPLMQAVLGLLGQNSSVGGLSGLVYRKDPADFCGTDPAGLRRRPSEATGVSGGLSSEATGGQLANLLPGLIDKLTPDGKMPDTTLIEQGLNLLRGKLG